MIDPANAQSPAHRQPGRARPNDQDRHAPSVAPKSPNTPYNATTTAGAPGDRPPPKITWPEAYYFRQDRALTAANPCAFAWRGRCTRTRWREHRATTHAARWPAFRSRRRSIGRSSHRRLNDRYGKAARAGIADGARIGSGSATRGSNTFLVRLASGPDLECQHDPFYTLHVYAK